MWEVLGWATLVLVLAGAGWYLVRLLRSEQGRDRSYDSNEDMTSNEAETNYDQVGGGDGQASD